MEAPQAVKACRESPWIVSICAVVFEKEHGAMVCDQFPSAESGAALSAAEESAIAFHALPVSPGAARVVGACQHAACHAQI
jgi:hypothetical protein